MSTEPEVFDYVVVGAGAAGCVLTNQLVEDGRNTVCLLEAGPKDRSIYLHIPGGFIKTVTNPAYTWQFKTEASKGSGGRRIGTTQGRTLGGSTAINGFNYNRGQPSDFDNWAALGNRGWGYLDLLPYFKRTERRIGRGDVAVRGTTGLLPITDCDWRHPLCDAFIESATKFGMPAHVDYNGPRQTGAGYFQRWIYKGWRVSAARAFLAPISHSKKLQIKVNAQAVSVMFDGRRAVGVRYASGPNAPTREAQARKEVIVCAGAANSPKLLHLSGVGPANLLHSIGVAPIAELSAVGENLRDHYLVRLVMRVKGVRTINWASRGPPLLGEIAKWAVGRPSILAISPSVAYGFTNVTDPALEPNVQLNFTPGSYKASVSGLLDSFEGATLGVYQMRPESLGYVRARSAHAFDDPEIQPNYLSREEDRRIVIDGIRLVRRIFNSQPLSGYCERMELPDASVVTDDEILQFAGEGGNTAYHLMGTCRMGRRDDPNTVVDDQLKVIGVDGLRVVDASIMPTMPSANIAASVFVIAEKAADLILGRPPLERSVIEQIPEITA